MAGAKTSASEREPYFFWAENQPSNNAGTETDKMPFIGIPSDKKRSRVAAPGAGPVALTMLKRSSLFQ